MKVRVGHVSNSSTSSFIMCGYFIETGGMSHQGIIQKLFDKTSEEIVARMKTDKYYKGIPISPDLIEEYCSGWIHNSNVKRDGFDVFTGDYSDGFIVGLNIEDSDMDLDEIKAKMDIIKERLGLEGPAKIHSGTYYC